MGVQTALRRPVAALLSCIFCSLLCGCGVLPLARAVASPTPVPSPTVMPTPTPSPSPAPVIAVFGAQGASAFQDGVSEAASAGDYAVVFEPDPLDALSTYEPAGSCAAIVLLQSEEDAPPDASIPVFVFAAEGQRVSPDIPHLTYADAYAAETALSIAVAYPPHETPVRLIGLFSSAESRAYVVWREFSASGKVFPKAEFFLTEPAQDNTPEPEEGSPSPSPDRSLLEQFSALFSGFYPGMIDGVFAETGALGIAASEALASLGREDIEVFAASTTGGAQRLLSPLLVASVGANYFEAGGLCYSAASALLGGETVAPFVLLPQTFSYTPNP